MNPVHDHFGCILRAALKRRYKKPPSAAFVAREFNLRSKYGSPVSNETARRWIRGVSIPDAVRLVTLARWLDIDFNAVFGEAERAPSSGQDDHGASIQRDLDLRLALNDELYERLSGLDKVGQEFLLKILNTYSSVLHQNSLTRSSEQNPVCLF